MESTKKSLITKTLERCRSIGGGGKGSPLSKAKSWPRQRKEAVPPAGWFAVYVGDGKERFVIRTSYLNHPLFRSLLEEAEAEFGYATDGPLELPCCVDLFQRLLWEVEHDVTDEEPCVTVCPSPLRRRSSYQLLSPSPSQWTPSGRSRRCFSSSQLKYCGISS